MRESGDLGMHGLDNFLRGAVLEGSGARRAIRRGSGERLACSAGFFLSFTNSVKLAPEHKGCAQE